MMTFPEIRLGKTRPPTDRVKARAGARRRRMTSNLEALEERTLLSFTVIPQPGDSLANGTVYTAGTTLIPIQSEGSVTSITDGVEMVSFTSGSPATPTTMVGGAAVPDEWNVTPYVETPTPNYLENDFPPGGSITLTLSQPADVFGVEMQWAPFPQFNGSTNTMEATFYDGATPVASSMNPISQPISETAPSPGPSDGGALLFAAQTNQVFTSVVLTNLGGSGEEDEAGIAIAQVRYALPPPITPQLTGTTGNEITGVEGAVPPPAPAVPPLLGTFYDGNQASTAADYTTAPGSVVVNWGDGSATMPDLQTLGPGNLTAIGTPNGVTWEINAGHDYTEEGTYAYTVTVTDVGGESCVVSGSAIIWDAPLIALSTQPAVAQTEPNLFPVPQFGRPALAAVPVAYFFDANPAPPTGSSTIADFTATIDWGDGTPPSAGTVVQPGGAGTQYIVDGSHTYAEQGAYPIQVFIVDDGGSKLTVNNEATVAAPVLAVTATGDGLAPTSDSGLSTDTSVVGNVVTNVNTPTFNGNVTDTPTPGAKQVPEANAQVTLDAINAAGAPILIGTGVTNSLGAWSIKSTTALLDGTYKIQAMVTDQFGLAPTTSIIMPKLLIDTTGPVIDGMNFNRLNGQVDYTIQDPVNPDGTAPSGVWVNTLLDSSNYQLTKVHAGKAYPGEWIVTSVNAAPDPVIANAEDVAVTFNGGAIIQGGYYLFTIRDSSNGNSSVQDLAENHLDGVFYGAFPSGNGINGSDFVAELEAVHNKVYAPQTIIGTANAQNGGDAPIHSGIWVPVVPVGGSPIFATTTSPTDPVHGNGKKASGSADVKVKHTVAVSLPKTSHTPKASLVVHSNNHPKGPAHKS